MITEYHRPGEIHQAVELISRQEPETRVLAGGTSLNSIADGQIAVVDIQDLHLDQIKLSGNKLHLGAMVRLQQLLLYIENEMDGARTFSSVAGKVIRKENSYNLRLASTVAGILIASDGRSPFTTLCLAMDVGMNLVSKNNLAGETNSLGDLLPLRAQKLKRELVESLLLPTNVKITYHSVSRSPNDLPIVCAAAAQWPSGRTRLALGGFGDLPLMVYDGNGVNGMEISAADAFFDAGDEWASAEYRVDVASVLALRCKQDLIN